MLARHCVCRHHHGCVAPRPTPPPSYVRTAILYAQSCYTSRWLDRIVKVERLLRDHVIERGPDIAILRRANMANTGKGEMAAGDPIVIISGHFEYVKALFSRCLGVRIKGTLEQWIRKL
jgi:hypothetical protein